MRLGVFGGTFDPIHLGHLIVAEQCREQAGLDRLLFVPAARPPHKVEHEMTQFHNRVEMLRLATAGHNAFQIDEMEQERSGPSYTAVTLQALREREAQAELFLILGADMVQDLPRWYQPRSIVQLAHLLVVARTGWELLPPEKLQSELALESPAELRMTVVHTPLVEISSTDIRQRVRLGRSIRYFVPRSVEEYIRERRLYCPKD